MFSILVPVLSPTLELPSLSLLSEKVGVSIRAIIYTTEIQGRKTKRLKKKRERESEVH